MVSPAHEQQQQQQQQQQQPLRQRVCQVLGVMLVTYINYLFFVPDALLMWWLARATSWWLAVGAALAWMYWDRHAPYTGCRRRWHPKRLHWLGLLLRDYFPVRVEWAAGAGFEPTQNYIIDVHPHGFGFCGLGGALYSGDRGFLTAGPDPGYNFNIVSHPIFFQTPLLREVAITLGMVSAKERSFKQVLGESGRGRILVMYSGALEELGRMRQDVVHFYLRRRGFCRLALLEGASLVPAIMLGENLLFRQGFPGLQGWIRRLTGVAVNIPTGRGVAGCTALPHRRPLMFVVGAPIAVEKTANPTREQVQELHGRYVRAIRQLYEQYGPKYSTPALPLIVDT